MRVINLHTTAVSDYTYIGRSMPARGLRQSPKPEQAKASLHQLGENWGGKYAIAVKSRAKN